ncbi:MAG: aldo/keto reductase [Phycisphaerales bacterium]|nr:aldo/keto reductase [Phycisphaerales bacterium]
MVLRPLGTTGLSVSPLGLGTVKIGRNTGVKYPGGDGFALPDDAVVAELFRTAAELGINLIDTAPAYGASEERIGAIMSANGWFGGRERWVVCTKAGEEFDARAGASRHVFSAPAVRASVERSLKRLGVQRLDLVLLHSDGRDAWIVRESGGAEELDAAVRRGEVRAWGLSAKTAAGATAALERGCGAVMVTLNRGDESSRPVIEAARTRGVGLLVKKALASGHAADPGDALRFALSVPGVSSVVVGTINPAHLRGNVGGVTRGGF